MTETSSIFIIRESFGTYGYIGPPPYKPWEALKKENEETRFTLLSPDAKYFAVGNSSLVNIFKTEDGSISCVIPRRMLSAKLSPQGGYIIAWDNPNQNLDNFSIWSLNGSKKKASASHSQKLTKMPESQFSWDEKIYARLTNDLRIIFYETPDFQTEIKRTPEDMKISNFSLSTGNSPLHYICYVRGGKEQNTSSVKLFKYPNVEASSVICQRSSFQSERVDIKWNKRGTAALVTTMTDVDKTGGSYYGKTSLEYLDTRANSYKVQLAGPDSDIIHASKWSPTSTEFCIIVGKMPNTRAALMNSKCEKILDMDIAARNEIYFNPQGNLVLLCGLGNLPGTIEVWELKKHKRCVAQFRVQTTTQVEWLNDGAHFITATTAPRMQVDNGFKVWDFRGKSILDWVATKHLFGITSVVSHENKIPFPESELDAHIKAIESKPKNPKAEEKAAVYIPVHKRTGTAGSPMVPKSQQTKATASNSSDGDEISAKQRKIQNLQKKLNDIQKLKAELANGKTLEKNQLVKINNEETIRSEIESLQLS